AGPVSADIARLHPTARWPGCDLAPALARSWHRWCARYLGPAAAQESPAIGLIGSPAPEDQDQLRAHATAARSILPRATLEFGTPGDLNIKSGRAWLRDRPLDLIFRYYPLDWLVGARFEPLLDLIASGDLPMLPPAHALIPQSKAFLGLLRELLER